MDARQSLNALRSSSSSLSISRWKERKQGTLVTKQDRKASEAVNIRTSHHIHMIHRTGPCYMISFMLIYDLAHQQLEYILHLYKTDTHSKHQLGHCLSLCHQVYSVVMFIVLITASYMKKLHGLCGQGI